MSQKFEDDIHPEEKSLLGFQILLTWLNPLIQLSNQRPLVDNDVWSPPTRDRVHQTAALFWEEWEKEIDACEGWNDESIERENRKKPPSLLRALFRAFGWKLVLGGLLQFSFFLFQIGQPFLVGQLVSYIQNGDGGIRVGIGYALGFAALSMCSSVCLAITFDNMRRLGSVMRSVLMIAIYEQGLKLTTAARMSNTIGQTTNLMSIDAEKLNLAVQFLHFLWHGPLLALVVVIIFIIEIGYAPALACMAVFCLVFPLQNICAKRIGQIRQKMVKFTDERVKLINEMLQSIRVIKLYAWEDALEKRVNSVRKEETKLLLAYLTSNGHLRELIFAVQPIAALTMFCIATYAVRDPLTVPQFFRMIAFLNITRFPLNLFGQAMKNVSDAMVSLQRLNRFFLLPTLRNIKARQPVDLPKITIDHAYFSWQDSSLATKKADRSPSKKLDSTATAQGINLKEVEFTEKKDDDQVDIENQQEETAYFRFSNLNFRTTNSNDLIAVIGPVGSGKSSFMSALLGEMILQRGKSEISGTVSYCAQTPWIQNITLRQNVLFKVEQEHATEEVNQLYRASIEAAALLPDIKILPAGDMTEIGERGINLSGGQKARVSIARAFFTSYSSQICLFDDPFSAVDGNTGNAIFQRGILQLLENKLRIIALNSHMHLLKYFDRVVVLQNGRIFADGTLSELFNQYPDEMAKITGLKGEEILRSEAEIGVEEGKGERQGEGGSPLKKSYSLSARTVDAGGSSPSSLYAEVAASLERAAILRANRIKEDAGTVAMKEQGVSDKPVEEKSKANSNKKEKKLISEEKADAGISTLVAYVKYFSASLTSVSKITRDPFYAKSSTKKVFSYSLILRGVVFIFALITIFSISQLVRVFVDLYLAKYVQHYLDGNNVTLYKNLYFGCFGILIFSLLVRSTYLNIYSVRSSQVLHAYMLRRTKASKESSVSNVSTSNAAAITSEVTEAMPSTLQMRFYDSTVAGGEKKEGTGGFDEESSDSVSDVDFEELFVQKAGVTTAPAIQYEGNRKALSDLLDESDLSLNLVTLGAVESKRGEEEKMEGGNLTDLDLTLESDG